MNTRKPKILIIDNEIEICNLLKDFFDFVGYESSYETNGEKVFKELEQYEYDLLFVDLRLNNITGIDILKKSKQIKPLSEVLIITGYGTEETILQTLQLGAFSYIQKPISFSEIKVQAEEALAKYRFNNRTMEFKSQVSNICENFTKHFDDIVHLDKLSELLNLTIDIDGTMCQRRITGTQDQIVLDVFVKFGLEGGLDVNLSQYSEPLIGQCFPSQFNCVVERAVQCC